MSPGFWAVRSHSPQAGKKETFQALIEETLGETCDIETVKTIHEKLTKLAEEHKEEPEPLMLIKMK